MLGRYLLRGVVGSLCAVQLEVAKQDGAETERAADSNRQEDEARLFNVEVVDPSKGIRDGGEEAEQDSKIDCNIETEEADHWFRKQHVHWPNKTDLEKLLNAG